MYANTETTSQEAYQAIKPKLPSLREKVLNVVIAAGMYGATMEDIRRQIPEARIDSINPRLSELQKRNLVAVSGVRRNSSNRNMKVWIAA